MDSEPFKSSPSEKLQKLADSLGDIRDSLVMVSMALTDLVAELPSPARDEVVIEVERFLARLSEAKNRDFD